MEKLTAEGLRMIAGHLALIVAAVFSGAAIYVNLVEQPARLGLDDREVLAEWKPSYKRGFAMQAPLALAGFALGLAAWWQTRELLFLAGGIAMLANWPWTIFVINPVNAVLNATELAQAGAQTRALIAKWGRLHTGRSVFGFVANDCFLSRLRLKLTPNRNVTKSAR
jgi:hypothetical protein